jgi:tyrosyl-tRNA synthetase
MEFALKITETPFLPLETLKALFAKAAAQNKDPERLLAEIITREVSGEASARAPKKKGAKAA